jgi:hypothetical protein
MIVTVVVQQRAVKICEYKPSRCHRSIVYVISVNKSGVLQ